MAAREERDPFGAPPGEPGGGGDDPDRADGSSAPLWSMAGSGRAPATAAAQGVPDSGQGAQAGALVGVPERIDYEKASEGGRVVLVADSTLLSNKHILTADLPKLVRAGFSSLVMDVIPASVDTNDPVAVQSSMSYLGPVLSGAYYRLYAQAKESGMRVTPAGVDRSVAPGDLDERNRRYEAAITKDLAETPGKVLLLAFWDSFRYGAGPSPSSPGPAQVHRLLAQKGIGSVVWWFHPTDEEHHYPERDYGELDELVEEHQEDFMVQTLGPSRQFDRLIVRRLRYALAPPDELPQDPAGSTRPVHAEAPAAPAPVEHAALPQPSEQPLDPGPGQPEGQAAAAGGVAPARDGATGTGEVLADGVTDDGPDEVVARGGTDGGGFVLADDGVDVFASGFFPV